MTLLRHFLVLSPRHAVVALAIALAVSLLGSTANADNARECFPSCRSGYVCSPAGQCISACNPACDEGELCTSAGECKAKAPSREAEHSATSTGTGTGTTAEEEATHFTVTGGALYQALSPNDGNATVAAGAPGLTVAGHYEFGDRHRIFVGPRFQLLLFDYQKVPEFGIDVGYRGRFGHGLVRVGPAAWLETQLWVANPVLPFVGSKFGVWLDIGPFVVNAALGPGIAMNTTHSNVYTSVVFNAGGEVGVRF